MRKTGASWLRFFCFWRPFRSKFDGMATARVSSRLKSDADRDSTPRLRNLRSLSLNSCRWGRSSRGVRRRLQILMSSLADAAFVIATGMSILWAAVVFWAWKSIDAFDRLPSHRPTFDVDKKPKVTAIIPSRNARKDVERAVQHLLAQEGVQMQVIVVDDDSTDGTWEYLERLTASEPSVVALHPRKLPTGWVAKNYALELGQGRAEGDFLLFTEADAVHGRRSVAMAIEKMVADDLDHIAVHPRLEAGSLVEAVVLPLHFIVVGLRCLDRRAAAFASGVGTGIGAFNLVRAEAYRLRGTHARIRGSIAEEQALGRMMRTDGGRGTVVRAVTQVRLRPYTSLKALYSGIRGEILGSFGHRASAVFLASLIFAAAALGPVVLLIAAVPVAFAGHIPWMAIPAFFGILLPGVALLKARSLVRFEPLAVILFPLGAMLIATAALHTALAFAFRGRFEWQGHSYSRADLSDMI